jgi:hypothetical protein
MSIKQLIKYFEVKYTFRDTFNLTTKISDTMEESKSISQSKMLGIFIETVLYYYSKNDLNVSPSNSDNSTKLAVMQLFNKRLDMTLAVKLYDLLDFMFKTFKEILSIVRGGFIEWTTESDNVPLQFETTLIPNIDLMFYIIFMHKFPQELRSQLKQELRISDLDFTIAEKCNDVIIKDSSICNINKKEYKLINHSLSRVVTRLSGMQITNAKERSPSPTKTPKRIGARGNLFMNSSESLNKQEEVSSQSFNNASAQSFTTQGNISVQSFGSQGNISVHSLPQDETTSPTSFSNFTTTPSNSKIQRVYGRQGNVVKKDDSTIPLNTKKGILMMLKIFNDLRTFHNRRQSRRAS